MVTSVRRYIAAAASFLLIVSGGPAAASPLQPVEIKVLSVGLNGFVHYDGPCVIRFKVRNPGPARTVRLKLVLQLSDKGPLPVGQGEIFVGYKNAFKELKLKKGQVLKGKWVLPALMSTYAPDRRILLVASDESGRVVGRAMLPEFSQANPVAILTLSKEDARPIRNAVLWLSESDMTAGYHNDVALVSSCLPELWYEYNAARMVVLAMPWSGLGKVKQTALRRWVSFGGTLVIVPQLSPDWRNASWGDLFADSTGGARYGAGRVFLTPVKKDGVPLAQVEEKALRDWFNATGLFQSYFNVAPVYSYPGTSPLVQAYMMPDTLFLILFIIGIIILVGPVVHLVLVRFRRREWAWIAVPGLSLVLALGTYGVSTGVKGEGTVLEVHHVLRNFSSGRESPVTTFTRMMSSEKQYTSIGFEGVHPVPGRTYSYPDVFGGAGKVAPVIRPDRVRLSNILMPRWSYEDLHFLSVIPTIPLDVQQGEGKISIANSSGMVLRDIMVFNGKGWVAVGPVLKPGQHIDVAGEHGPADPEMLEPHWDVEGGMESMARVLLSSITWYKKTSTHDIVVAAHCKPSGLPEVEMSPAPDSVYEITTCLWKESLPSPAGGGER